MATDVARQLPLHTCYPLQHAANEQSSMPAIRICANIGNKARVLVLAAVFCGAAFAQEPTLVEFKTAVLEAPVISHAVLPEAPRQHRFWDRENGVLFSTVAMFSAADFAATRANLANGGRELNPVTRLFSGSTAALATNFAGETAGVIGVSYFFHRTGHHKLERIAPVANVAASAFAVAYDLAHRR
jgi:hypothetical protein